MNGPFFSGIEIDSAETPFSRKFAMKKQNLYVDKRSCSGLGMKINEPVADLESPSRFIKDFFSADEAIREVS